LSDGRFDTDATALRRRIEAHERFAARPLEPWLFELLDLRPGLRCLELGCGDGKQTLPLARALGEQGSVVAVDASGESLAALEARRPEGASVRTIEADFDRLAGARCELRFDRALSCYALYYAREPERVIRRVHSVLAEGGSAVVCGPGRDNNRELLELQASAGGKAAATPAVTFMEERAPRIFESVFGGFTAHRLENPLGFDSAGALLDYWRSHNLYDPEIEVEFAAAAERHVARFGGFETVKRVVAIRAQR
jgi:SAM-dependent methyltransferase